MRKLNIAFFCLPGLDTFLKDIMTELSNFHNVRLNISNTEDEIRKDVDWADIVWLEWGNELAIALTKTTLLDNKYVVMRVHSYEILAGYIIQIQWEKVNDVIFVAKHIKEAAEMQWSMMEQQQKINISRPTGHLIPNGLNTELFTYEENKWTGDKYNVAFVGTVNAKKGPMLLMHAFNELWKTDHRYKLHIAGAMQDARFGYYIGHMTKVFGWAEDTMSYYHHVENIAEWLKDKHYIVCTSPWESQGLGIMEAMLSGCKPVIHNFVGAENVYDTDFLWNTISEFVNLITVEQHDPERYRDFVVNRYAMKDMIIPIRKLLDNAPITVVTADNIVGNHILSALRNKRTPQYEAPPVASPTEYLEDRYWNMRAYPTTPTMTAEKTQEHIDYIKSHLGSMDNKILDFGPGIGRTFAAYKDVYSVQAVDVSMLYTDRVKAEAAKYDFQFALKYITTAGTQEKGLPFKDNEFDVAVASEVLLHQRPENIVRIMAELARVAKQVIVISWAPATGMPCIDPFAPPMVSGSHHCLPYDYKALCERLEYTMEDVQYTEDQIYFTYRK